MLISGGDYNYAQNYKQREDIMVIEVGMSVVKVDVIENQLRLAIMNPADDTARVYCPAQSAEVFLDYEEATDVINSLINLQGRINGTRQRSQIEC